MKQLDFENRHSTFWQDFSLLLDQLDGTREKTTEFDQAWPLFPAHYRTLCQHLSLAQSRQYSPLLTDKLHSIVLRGHKFLYQHKPSLHKAFTRFIAQDFPRALRQDWKPWLISSLLFYLPGFFMGIMCFLDNNFIYTIMDYSDVKNLEYMYNPDTDQTGRSEGRQSDSDFYMFGHYIMNNIGIDFRTYATGIAFGLGSIFFMVFNGLYIGAAAGHLTKVGFSETFWPFVSGHSALELTAATIAGAAGLKLGYSLINPAEFTRLLALKHQGKKTIPLITGAALLTLLAAFVEGFWSATPYVSNEIKYTVGILAWLALFSYLLMAGRK